MTGSATPFFERLWLADLRSELLSFPAGRHDDQVDALGLVGQLLDTMVRPAPPRPKLPPRDRWDRLFERQERERGNALNWKCV